MREGSITVFFTLILISTSVVNYCEGADDTEKICGPTISQDGLVGMKLFNEQVNITENSVWQDLSIHDLDGNGYPDILASPIYSRYYSQEYGKGLYSLQMNSNRVWSMNKINDSLDYVCGIINLYEDNDMDLFNSTVIYETENGKITDRQYPVNFSNSQTGVFSNDIDCDGDYDIIAPNNNGNNIFFSINNGTGGFSDGWDEGIPRRNYSDFNSNKYYSSEHGVWDVNNDGWPDICSAMGAGPASVNPGPCQFYNWVSDGNGSWTSHSKGFPIGEWGKRLDLSDIDEDGDMDYVLITDRNVYLYENINGTRWERRPFPIIKNNIFDLMFADVDDDGYEDLIVLETVITPDPDLMKPVYNNSISIAFSNGNFTWNVEHQTYVSAGDCSEMLIEDMDRDGDKDIIINTIRYQDWWGEEGSIIFLENHLKDRKDLTFVDEPHSKHLRSGSVQRLSWTCNNSYSMLDKDVKFFINVSYTGMDGPFLPFKEINNRWWTEIIIPDIPTSELFFMVETGERSGQLGPYTIHNSEDLTSMILLEDPDQNKAIISDREQTIGIKTSKFFPTGDVNIYFYHENGTIELGPFHLVSNSSNRISINISEPVFWEDVSILFSYKWNSQEVRSGQLMKIDLVPSTELPFRLLENHFSIPSRADIRIYLTILTSNNSNVSRDSIITLHGIDEDLTYDIKGNGLLEIRYETEGSKEIQLNITRFGHTTKFFLTVTSCIPLASVSIKVNDPTPLVGEEFEIWVDSKDVYGADLGIPLQNFTWNYFGEAELLEFKNDIARFRGYSPGKFQINISIDVGLGEINASRTVLISNKIGRIIIKTERDEMLENSSQICWIEVYDTNLKRFHDIEVGWKLGTGLTSNSTKGKTIELFSSEYETTTITAIVRFLDETVSISKNISILEAPETINMAEKVNIENGSSIEIPFSIKRFNGEEYKGEIDLFYSSSDPSIASVDILNDSIRIAGSKYGRAVIELSGSFREQKISGIVNVNVSSYPRMISINGPSEVRRGIKFKVPFEVLGLNKELITDYHVNTINTNCSSYISNGTIWITPEKVGNGSVILSASASDISTMVELSFTIHRNYQRIAVEDIIPILPVGRINSIKPVLVDDMGERVFSKDIRIISSGQAEFSIGKGNIDIWSNDTGIQRLVFQFEDFDGKVLTEEIDIEIYRPQILHTIEINEVANGNYKVIAFDENGQDITDKCNITWVGEFRIIDSNIIDPSPGKFEVMVSFNGTTLSKEFEVKTFRDENSQFPIILIIIFSIATIGFVLIFVFLMIKRRTRLDENPILTVES